MGDPAGVGPEVLLKSYKKARKHHNLIAISDFDKIKHLAKRTGIKIRKISHTDEAKQFGEYLNILHLKYKADFSPGYFDPLNSNSIVNSIKMATDLCLKRKVNAMVTGPINKAIIKSDMSFEFTGHTDFIEHLCTCKKETALMMMMNSYLKVIPLTIHEPLNKISRKIKKTLIEIKLNLIISEFRKYFNLNPRIAVLGLNPHAGENGHLGTEEILEISPSIKKVQKNNNCIIRGPFSADGFFGSKEYKNYDVILAMYHDQALIPLKLLDFQKTINITLGLPIIRTSPGHGTGIEIAKDFNADYNSFYQAILFAEQMISNSQRPSLNSVF